MKTFTITPIASTLANALREKIDTKTKPLGALGKLEDLAFQLGSIQNTVSPQISQPAIVVFAGDHGIATKGEVNPFPQEVTAQMVLNFVNQGAAINVFCNTNSINLHVVDAGVNFDFSSTQGVIDAKIAPGTKNYQIEPAMSTEQCDEAIKKGAQIVESLFEQGTNVIGFGEMGIGNTSAAALIMSSILNIPVKDCVGAGTGLNDDGISKKAAILTQVAQKYQVNTPLEILRTYGGFEIAMLCGAFLKAAELKMTILVDGFIVTAALLVAHSINKNVTDYCVFAHTSNEQGHLRMLEALEAEPLLNIGLRLGEGTGAALCLPMLHAAVNFLNEMASFADANVSTNE